GVVIAEYSLQDPRGWDYLRPILAENGGWALFNFVPRGKNHGWDLFDIASKRMADGDNAWFVQRLAVTDTGMEHIAETGRRDGLDEDLIQQELYCSFTGVPQGTVLARQLEQADAEGRVCAGPGLP